MTAGTARAAQHDAAGRHYEAIDELARATQAGDIEAMTELGKRLVIGDRAPLLPEDGTRFLADAMQAGSSEAALRLATMAALGAHVEQSWGHALGLLVRAADQGSESAHSQLSVLGDRAARRCVAGGRLARPRRAHRSTAHGSRHRRASRCTRSRSCAASASSSRIRHATG